MTGIILNTPILIILYGIAFFFCVYDLIKKATGYVFPLLSAGIFVCASVYAFLLGAGFAEVAAVALLFLLLHLISENVHTGGGK